MSAYEAEKGVTGARLHHRAVVLQEEAARAAAAAREANEERDAFVAEGRERGWISR